LGVVEEAADRRPDLASEAWLVRAKSVQAGKGESHASKGNQVHCSVHGDCVLAFEFRTVCTGLLGKDLNCFKTVVLWPKPDQKAIDATVTVGDPRDLRSDQGLTALLDKVLKDVLPTCRARGANVVNIVQIKISSHDQTLYDGWMSASDKRWRANSDNRGWTIPNIVQKLDAAQSVREQAAKEPPSATSQDAFCSNFARHRGSILSLQAQRQKETNPLRAQQVDAQINEALKGASTELSGLYGSGLKRFASYGGRVFSLSDAGFGRIEMTVSIDCVQAPIAFHALFSNEPIEDPPSLVHLGLLSSLPSFRNVLMQLNKGERVRMDGIFRRFVIQARDLSSISPTETPISLRVRIGQMSKL